MRVKKFPVTIYLDEEGWYVVECPVIPGCMSQGRTEEEALRNIQEAIQLCLEVQGEPSDDIEFVGVQRIRIPA